MPESANKEEIRALCTEAGFSISEARDDGKMLILVPENLHALPDADTLRRLADRIRQYQYRHVAFSVDPD